MRGTRHRQELREPLHCAEHDCREVPQRNLCARLATTRFLRLLVFLRAASPFVEAGTGTRAAALPRQKVTMAAAMNTLEYVPVMMPTIIVNAKPFSTSPPNRYSDTTLSSVVPAVMMVRPSVWLIDVFMMSQIESRRMSFRFSRTRSKMTMVSLVE